MLSLRYVTKTWESRDINTYLKKLVYKVYEPVAQRQSSGLLTACHIELYLRRLRASLTYYGNVQQLLSRLAERYPKVARSIRVGFTMQKFNIRLHLERVSTARPIPESKLRKILSEGLNMLEEDIEVTQRS